MSKVLQTPVVPRSVAPRLLLLVLPLLVAGKSWAQFSNPITTTPAFMQDGFGPAGDLLPFGGQEYCCPTGAAISLSYLGVNGFNQLGLASPTPASELSLVQVLSGLMGTDPIQGTATLADVQNGIAMYLTAEGISASNYSLTVTGAPTVSTLAGLNQPGTVVDLIGGFYDSSGNRDGGHCIALVGQQVNVLGQSSPNTIVINNPLPGALTPNADVTGNVTQYLNTISTSGNLTGDGAIELDPSQYPGQWTSQNFVIENAIALTINTSQLSVNNPTAATWTIATAQTINLNGGTLPVLAPITGAGGISLGANGLLLAKATNTSTGANTINGGTWESTIASGQPFGTGSINFTQGALTLSPAAGSSSINLSAASGSGNTMTLVDGAEIALSLNGNTSLTLTIGGNTDTTTANLVRTNNGSLIFAPAGGTADLGKNERVLIAGSASNLPQLTNGIVAPYFVVQNTDGAASGDFVTYASTLTNGFLGFTKATYSTATAIASAGSSAIFLANTAQTVAASATVQVYALNVESVTVGGGSSSILQVGPQTGGLAGIILNGGTISTPTLALGAAEGDVYVSNAGGTISSVISGISGSRLTTFGPGTLTLEGANTYTGTTDINSGILNVQNTSGSATGTGHVNAQTGGTLEITGSSAKAGGSGTSTINTGGALLLVGGTMSGTLKFDAGSYLFGNGTISGSTTLSGIIGNSGTPSNLPTYTGVENITFTNDVTFNTTTIYSWKLNALDANSGDAGTDWSLLTFKGASTNLGLSGSPFNLTLDLGGSVPDPDGNNSFWNTSHQWLIGTDASGFNNVWWDPDFPTFSQGFFSLSTDAAFENIYVNYTPVAAPEPGSAVLTGLGLALVNLHRRRKTGSGRTGRA